MATLNKVLLIGNLTKDPALRYTPGGAAVADLRLAINTTYVNKAGERTDEVCYVDIVVWARQAETAAEYLSKGSPIFVEGRLQLDTWETSAGEKRSKMRVRAQRIQFLGRAKGSAPRDEGQRNSAPRDEGQRNSTPQEREQYPGGMGPGDATSDDVPF